MTPRVPTSSQFRLRRLASSRLAAFLTTALSFAATVFASNPAEAVVSFDVVRTSVSSGKPLDGVGFGDLVTLDVRMSNPTGVAIYGIGAGVQGWDPNVAALVSAETNSGPYFCQDANCEVGLVNVEQIPNPTNPIVRAIPEFRGLAGVDTYVSLVQAVSLDGPSGDGSRDPGLDGIVGGGDAQFRVTFRMVGVHGSRTTIEFGSNPNAIVGNVVVLRGSGIALANNASVTLTMAPEPGHALLIGLGLSALSWDRRRYRS